jgi:vacuolar protein 8
VYSNRIQLQRTAALAFAEITEKGSAWFRINVDVRVVDRDTIEPLLFLLQSSDQEVQRASSAALGNLAVNGNSNHTRTNRSHQQSQYCPTRGIGASDTVNDKSECGSAMQCCRMYNQPRNSRYVLKVLLMTDENKNKIARSTALGPLTRLARSKDIRVQRNATGALLNMTHSGRF